MPERPPVELQEIDLVRLEPVQGALDRGTRRLPAVIGPGGGHHLVKTAGRVPGRTCTRPAASSAVEAAGDILGAAVMVRHVEGVEAGLGIGGKVGGGALLIELLAVALHVGDLPEAGD